MSRGTPRSRRILHASLLAALVLVATAGPVEAKSKVKTKTFSSGPINRPIPDAVGTSAVGIEDSLQIKKRGRVKDVDVSVRITHPNTTDLDLDIFRFPGGGLLVEHQPQDGGALSSDFGAGPPACEGAVFTTFDDEASTLITAGTNPFAGSFQPDQPLSGLNGAQLKGKWRLGLTDGSPTSVGTLNCWQVTVRYKPQRKRKR